VTKLKHKKLVLSPVGGVTCQHRDLRGYTPQDAIIDWSVGRPFKATHIEEYVCCEDVHKLIRDGYTMLVFTCGGSSESLVMVEIEKDQTTRQTTHGKFRFEQSALYCTQDVVDSLTYIRKWQK